MDSHESHDLVSLHKGLVDQLKDNGAVRSPAVEAAFRAVPRHLFVPPLPPEDVYQDRAIQIKAGVSSSQPTAMAMLLEQLGVEPGHRVLEIGVGTGYNAAILAELVGPTGKVVTLDFDAEMAGWAEQHLIAAGYPRSLQPAGTVCSVMKTEPRTIGFWSP